MEQRSKFLTAAVLAFLAAYAPTPAAAQTEPDKKSIVESFACATVAGGERGGGTADDFLAGIYQLSVQYHWFGDYPGIDFSAMTPKAQVQYLRDYCKAHPSETYGNAFRSLLAQLKSPAKDHVPPAQVDVRELEAPADVRAFVLAQAIPIAMAGIEGVVDGGPDLVPGLSWRLARNTDGKVEAVPDMFAIAFNDTGAALPRFPPDFKTLAAVYPRRLTHDRPPSGDDDHDLRSAVPAFYIGSRGRDVWEVGRVGGVSSIRLVSGERIGAWEPFQKDPSRYRLYGQHYLDGRTAEENFADPRVAALTLAGCAGDKVAVAKALRGGADPNGKGIDGDTPLFWALDCRNTDGLEALLKAGADPNYKLPGKIYEEPQGWSGHDPKPAAMRTYRYSPTYLALIDHDFAAVRLMLRYGGNPDVDEGEQRGNGLVLGLLDPEWDRHRNDFPDWDLHRALLDADKDIGQGCKSERAVDDLLAEARYDLVEEILKRGYDCNLADLAWMAQGHSRRRAQGDPARLRINEILKQRGVEFPPHSRFERLASVVMQDDGSLRVHWGDLHSRRGAIEPDQVVRKGEPHYDELIARAGDLKPGEKKLIERRPGDARD